MSIAIITSIDRSSIKTGNAGHSIRLVSSLKKSARWIGIIAVGIAILPFLPAVGLMHLVARMDYAGV